MKRIHDIDTGIMMDSWTR